MSPVDRAKRIQEEVGHVSSQYGVKNQDHQFLRDVIARNQQSLSAPQERWMKDIEKRVFGEDE